MKNEGGRRRGDRGGIGNTWPNLAMVFSRRYGDNLNRIFRAISTNNSSIDTKEGIT